jgi:hypothetical protein
MEKGEMPMSQAPPRWWFPVVLMVAVALNLTGGTLPAAAQTTPPPGDGLHQMFSFNDLGMHCYDADFSIFGVLPPYNVLHAQTVLKGQTPQLIDSTSTKVTYEAVADPAGSINTTSRAKTNFWTYVQQLFGATLAVDVGLKNARMPGVNNTPRPFRTFDPQMKWFSAEGIPITAKDDAKKRNTMSMMRISARDRASGTLLASLDTVVPASDEMNCSNCHLTGGVAANQATAQRHGMSANWSAVVNKGKQAKENILLLHDGINHTNLNANRPVLCASCHYSPALDLAHQGPQGDQVGKPYLSRAMHGHHGKTITGALPDATHPAIVTGGTTDACYQCHPGQTTKCLRGAMATAGLNCQDCHGDMLAVGGVFNLKTTGAQRVPWNDLPKCQSCHTGDAVSHQGSALILRKAFQASDPAATPIVATNKRFAETDNTLYRFSLGHNGMACSSCHGSPHAEWPVRAGANDNVTATQIQGHAGPIIECSACHGAGQNLTINGPHGLHNINDPDWTSGGHANFAEGNRDNCRACHGLRGEGTVLSKAAANRSLRAEGRTVNVTKGTPINCNMCHSSPL